MFEISLHSNVDHLLAIGDSTRDLKYNSFFTILSPWELLHILFWPFRALSLAAFDCGADTVTPA